MTQMKRLAYYSTEQVCFDYNEIFDENLDLNERIKTAFGPEGTGICTIKNVPNYKRARQNLLHLSYQLANLPQEEKAKLDRPEIKWSRGWQESKEHFGNKTDKLKSAFIALPLREEQTNLTQTQQQVLGDAASKLYQSGNVWPDGPLPVFKPHFKLLSNIMVDTSFLLAKHIDKYVSQVMTSYKRDTLYNLIKSNKDHVGRLNYYKSSNEPITREDDWNSWHTDYSALSALTSAIYMTHDGYPVTFDDRKTGLFFKNRWGEKEHINADKDSIIFQIGESMQILSGGVLEATPYCVSRSKKSQDLGLNRATFQLYLVPPPEYKLFTPSGIDERFAYGRQIDQVPHITKRWNQGIPFATFQQKTIQEYRI
ncbi:hypothetical protein ABPG72_001404 [Tetrahymena utriculariae]